MEKINRRSAILFVILFGMVSLFADMTYEGARSITGPYLKLLGGSATLVGFVAGFGELIGYTLRILTGLVADRTKRYWLLTFWGYAVNLLAVPLLALAGNWLLASFLLILERLGKAIRAPARDAMLSYARHEVGSGWTYGLHESMDQIGAILGPVIVAGTLFFRHGDYRLGYAVLLIPAVISLSLVLLAKHHYPNPEALEVKKLEVHTEGLPQRYWTYMLAVGLTAFGFADFPLIAYHLQTKSLFSQTTIPLLYALAMGMDAVAALVFGYLYDRIQLNALIIAVLCSFLFAPLVFLGSPTLIIIGVILWGIGIGWQESIMRSVLADLATSDKRASIFGIFNAGYGVMWFIGSLLLGTLYDLGQTHAYAIWGLIAVSVIPQLLAIPVLRKVSPH